MGEVVFGGVSCEQSRKFMTNKVHWIHLQKFADRQTKKMESVCVKLCTSKKHSYSNNNKCLCLLKLMIHEIGIKQKNFEINSSKMTTFINIHKNMRHKFIINYPDLINFFCLLIFG